jgi:hypothetical protein
LRSSHERKVIPLFCDVQPIDLRYIERGCYVDAFNKHQQHERVSMKLLEGWNLYKRLILNI